MALFDFNIDPLEALLKDAKKAEHQRVFKKMPTLPRGGIAWGQPLKSTPNLRETFQNPDNWVISKESIALIHRSPEGDLTLLGAFKEHRHKRIAIRRLIRTEEPQMISKEEYVTGSHWLNPFPAMGEYIGSDPCCETRLYELSIDLPELQLHNNHVFVDVDLESGWIRRVRLNRPTTFSCPTGREHCQMPSGLEILDVMSLDSKKALKALIQGS